MTDRLVLGDGPLVSSVASSLADKPGQVRVLTGDEDVANSLKEQGIAVSVADPTSEDSLDGLSSVDIVLALAETAGRNLAIARAVRAQFPDSYLIAYAGPEEQAALAEVADQLVDPTDAVAGALLQRAGDAGRQGRDLWGVLDSIDRLAVFTHDNPDPDAIGSGVALARLADAAGCAVDICYAGEINHQENRAFVNVLDIELTQIDDPGEVDEYDGVALVDHSQPGVNDQLPADTPVDIVIDHHPPHSPVDARFVDLRSRVGATSTLLTEYLSRFGLLADEKVTTALLFGIHVDTDGFRRGVSGQDFQAAGLLLPHADLGTIERIESPSVASRTLETTADAIQNRQVDGEILLSCVGRLSDRDSLAQAADQLLQLDGVSTAVVYGFDSETIYVSARARGTEIDLGETLREAFDQIGSAGGHVDMAGAQIGLGLFEGVDEDDASLAEVVEDVVANRFLEAVDTGTESIDSVYDLGRLASYREGTDETDAAATLAPDRTEETGTDLYRSEDGESVARPRDESAEDDD